MNVESLVAGFLRSSVRTPHAPAVEIGNRRWTYQELAATAWAVSDHVAKTAPCPVVALLAHGTIAAYAGALGILLAGRGFLPLHPRHPAARNAEWLKRSGVRALLLGDEGKAAWEAIRATGTLRDEPLDVLEPEAFRRDVPPRDPPVKDTSMVAAEDALACLYFSTKPPSPPSKRDEGGTHKGIAITHGNVASFLVHVRSRYRMRSEDRVSGYHDLTSDRSLHDMFLAWDAGACLVPVSEEGKLSPAVFIEEKALTAWYSGPNVVRSMLRAKQLRTMALSTLRLSLFGGEPLTVSAAKAWQEAAPNSILENVYGPTETTVAVSVHRFTRDDALGPVVNGNLPIGKLLADHRYRLVDEQDADAQPEADGSTTGEMLVCGPQVVHGYYGDPAMTAERFLLDAKGATWYRTGDRVRRDVSGSLHFLGRLEERVTVCDIRVDLPQVDHALREVAGTHEAATVPWPVHGGIAKGLVGFVAADSVDEPAVLKAMGWHLPPPLVPARVYAVPSLPLSENGKIDRDALLRRCAEIEKEKAA